MRRWLHRLPAGIQKIVEPLITDTVNKVTTLPGYPGAWEDTLRRSHALTFDAGSAASGTGTIRLDVTALIRLTSAELSNRIGIDVPAPQQTLVEVGTAGEYNAVQRFKSAADLWEVLALAAVSAALFGVLFARRRLTAAALLGLGVTITGGGLWLIAHNHRVLFPGQSDGSEVGRLFRNTLLERAADSYSAWMLALASAGMVLLVLGGIGRALRGRSRDGPHP